jgi:hypothetical protein
MALNKWRVKMTSAVFLLRGATLGMAVGALSLVIPANAQTRQAVPTNFPGVYAFTQPPASFNALTASPAELARWGYPPRPNASEGPEAMARWSQAVSPSLKRVIPQLAKHEGVFHRPATGLKVISANGNSANATSPNWSGYVLTPAAGANPFSNVSGTWTVPTVKQAPGTCSGGWDYSAQWVGIGGNTDAYLLQSGSEADVYCNIGNNVPQYYPWLEWYPGPPIAIYQNASTKTTYPFQPGDYLVVYVSATNWSAGVSTTGNVLFEDITQGWSFSLTFSAASVGGSKVTGQSAEWIVERTEVNGIYAALPDYIANPWYQTLALDLGGTTYYPGSPGTSQVYNITMLDNSNNPVSSVSLSGLYALWFFPEGSAVQ